MGSISPHFMRGEGNCSVITPSYTTPLSTVRYSNSIEPALFPGSTQLVHHLRSGKLVVGEELGTRLMELGTWCSFTGFGKKATSLILMPLLCSKQAMAMYSYPRSRASRSSLCSCQNRQGKKATHRAVYSCYPHSQASCSSL